MSNYYVRPEEQVFMFGPEEWRRVIAALRNDPIPEACALGEKLGLALATRGEAAGDFCPLDRLEAHYIRTTAERIGVLRRGD